MLQWHASTSNAMLCCCGNSIVSNNLSQLMQIPDQKPVLLHSRMCTTATLVIDRNCGYYSELSPQMCKPNCDGSKPSQLLL